MVRTVRVFVGSSFSEHNAIPFKTLISYTGYDITAVLAFAKWMPWMDFNDCSWESSQ